MRGARVLVLALLASCSRGDPAARERLMAREEKGTAAAAAFDPAHPEAALALDADEVARRLGSFEWTAAVEWSVARPPAAPVRVTEEHRLRQSRTGEFEVRHELDPGQGPSEVQGKQVVYVNGMTYARALPAPFRERPTDRGRDARRYREESFGLVRTLAAMLGPALRLQPDGGEVLLGREALRYRFSLGDVPARDPVPPPAGFQGDDPDTIARQGFLRDAVPTSAQGELTLDARTGAPLRARLSAAFDGPGGKERGARVSVVVSAQVKALGGDVKAVAVPSGALPDERKPAGPSTALEAAGLKKHGEERKTAEPEDEGE